MIDRRPAPISLMVIGACFFSAQGQTKATGREVSDIIKIP